MMSKKRNAGAALLLALFGIGATGATHAAGTNPRAFALRLSDLPAGFTQSAARVLSNAQSEKDNHQAKGTLTKHGRVTGFETDFKRSSLVGMIQVQDVVYEYKSSFGAQWQMAKAMQNADTPYKGHRLHRMSIGHVGDQGVGYVWTGKSGRYNFTLYTIVFRRGSYSTAVVAIGLTGTFGSEAAIHLALVIDNRIRLFR